MRRGITRRATLDLLRRIRSFVPEVALRTTLIVGYPDETREDFLQLCDFVEEARFHRLGVFPYSHEEGTSAFPLGDPIPHEVKEERLARIMEIQQRVSSDMNASLIGRSMRVLVDRTEGTVAVGRTEWDAPEIDQEAFINDAGHLVPGTFVKARITDAAEYDLYGTLVSPVGGA